MMPRSPGCGVRAGRVWFSLTVTFVMPRVSAIVRIPNDSPDRNVMALRPPATGPHEKQQRQFQSCLHYACCSVPFWQAAQRVAKVFLLCGFAPWLTPPATLAAGSGVPALPHSAPCHERQRHWLSCVLPPRDAERCSPQGRGACDPVLTESFRAFARIPANAASAAARPASGRPRTPPPPASPSIPRRKKPTRSGWSGPC